MGLDLAFLHCTWFSLSLCTPFLWLNWIGQHLGLLHQLLFQLKRYTYFEPASSTRTLRLLAPVTDAELDVLPTLPGRLPR